MISRYPDKMLSGSNKLPDKTKLSTAATIHTLTILLRKVANLERKRRL